MNWNKHFKGYWILAGIGLMVLSGCATIVRGKLQPLPVNSHPAGATVYVNGVNWGQTPMTLDLRRSREYEIIIALEGYEDVVFDVHKEFKMGAAVIGNLFSFGVLGLVVDVANGSAYQLTPEMLDTTLRRNDIALNVDPQAPDRLQVVFLTPDQVAVP